MKTDVSLPLNFSPGHSGQGNNKTTKADPNLTPYLKAILNGAVNMVNAGKANIAERNHDLAAAIRYIKESALLRK